MQRTRATRRTMTWIALCAAVLSLMAVPAAATTDAASIEVAPTAVGTSAAGETTDGILVSVTSDVDRVAAAVSAALGVDVAFDRMLDEESAVFTFEQPVAVDAVERAADALVNDGIATEAAPNYRITAADAPNDQHYGLQWYLHGNGEGGRDTEHINIERAWERTTGSSDVVVAVVDTGTAPHNDIDRRLVPGYNFIPGERGRDTTDRGIDCEAPPGMPQPTVASYHGNHVAGIIGASTNNSVGIAGVDQQARILPIRAITQCGDGGAASLVDAIRWAAGLNVSGAPTNNNPADVINMSLGAEGACPAPVTRAIDAAIDNGAIVVASAGNENVHIGQNEYTPAGCSDTIGVGSVSPNGARARLQEGSSNPRPYSNYGQAVDISAPGGDNSVGDWGMILSLGPTGEYWYALGTSMAAPQVAGVAALMRAENPSITHHQVKQVMRDTARPFNQDTGDARRCGSIVIRCGAGILNAGAAVRATPQPEPTFSDGGGVHREGIEWMAREGITFGCSETRFCAADPVTREQMASFIARATHLHEGSGEHFTDVNRSSTHGRSIDAIRREGVTDGCWSRGDAAGYCPRDFVTRAEMASFLARAEDYSDGSFGRFQDVRSQNTHAGAIGAIARERVTEGCDNAGRQYCPHDSVTRGQMASFLYRALG